MEKILTLREAVELGYNEKIYHEIWDKSSFFESQERFFIEDHMLPNIIKMYACVVDKLNIIDKIKKFDYNIKRDLIFVHLNDGSKVILPLTIEDIKNYTYSSQVSINNIVEFIKYFDKKRFKRKLSSYPKRNWYFYVLSAIEDKQSLEKTLTLHEAAELGYEEEIYHDLWKYMNLSKNPELFDIEDLMISKIINMYACAVDKLNILDQIKKFDYDIKTDLVFVHLNDGSKVILPLTVEDIKNYTYLPLMAVNDVVELVKYYDKKRFKRMLSSMAKRYWYSFILSVIGKKQNVDTDSVILTDELKSYYKSLERLDDQIGVETDRHFYQLSEEEQIAEDLFNLGFNAVQYMGLSNIKYIKCTWDDESLSEYEYQLYAVLNNDEEMKLNLSDSNKEYDEERHMEIDSLMYENNSKRRKNKISSIVQEESKKFFNKEDCKFKTDKVN